MRLAVDAVFIDRDGTMGPADDLHRPQGFVPFPFLKDSIRRLQAAGLRVFAFTNQSCIARGLDGGYDFDAEFGALGLDGWVICPHDDQDGCNCRKPGPGLLYQARDRFGVALARSAVIGDRWSDLLAGGRAGTKLILVLTGRGREALADDRGKWSPYEADCVADDLSAAVDWLLGS